MVKQMLKWTTQLFQLSADWAGRGYKTWAIFTFFTSMYSFVTQHVTGPNILPVRMKRSLATQLRWFVSLLLQDGRYQGWHPGTVAIPAHGSSEEYVTMRLKIQNQEEVWYSILLTSATVYNKDVDRFHSFVFTFWNRSCHFVDCN